MNKLVFLGLTAIPIIMMLNVTGSGSVGVGVNGTLTVQDVFAGGAREDWSDEYTDIPGAPECWVDGYDDGQNNPFSQDKHKDCIFDELEGYRGGICCNGKPYYEGFMYGCMDVEGNTQETCERFTD